MNSFKKSLAIDSNSRYSNLMNQYMIMTQNPEYFNFTCDFFSDACKIKEAIFPGVFTDDKARIKGKSSFEKKVKESIADNSMESNKNIYDIFGAKTVVLDFDSNKDIQNLAIDGYISRKNDAKKDFDLAKENKKSQELSNKNFETIKPYLDEIIAMKSKYYELCKDICNIKISEKLFDFFHSLPNLPEFKKYGLFIINSRDRDYNTSTQYIAKHLTFGSSVLPMWTLEWQFKSLNSYESARYGSSSHQHRKGKELVPPKSLDDISEDDFAHYIFHEGNGKLYIPGTFENLYHKYQPCFKDGKNADFLEKLLEYDKWKFSSYER